MAASVLLGFITQDQPLFEHYPEEKTVAQNHLDFAIDEFRDMKMQPALERALSHKGLLKA